MSSACQCHLGEPYNKEWCFYCEMYNPLERKHEEQTSAIEAVIHDLEDKAEYNINDMVVSVLKYSINKLKGVLAQHETQQIRSEENHD